MPQGVVASYSLAVRYRPPGFRFDGDYSERATIRGAVSSDEQRRWSGVFRVGTAKAFCSPTARYREGAAWPVACRKRSRCRCSRQGRRVGAGRTGDQRLLDRAPAPSPTPEAADRPAGRSQHGAARFVGPQRGSLPAAALTAAVFILYRRRRLPVWNRRAEALQLLESGARAGRRQLEDMSSVVGPAPSSVPPRQRSLW